MSTIRLILVEPGSETSGEFSGEEITVGRSKTTDLPIQSGVSSRLHCRLRQTPEGVLLEDLGSRNGTMLNGHGVTRPTKLSPGDKIEIGDSLIYFQQKAAPGDSSADHHTPVAQRAVVPVEVAPLPYKVTCIAGSEAGHTFNIQDQLSFGRRRANDIVLDDTESSGKHAKLFRKGRLLYLVDLKSTNGTFVSGNRISRRQMKDGEVFTIGHTSFKVIMPAHRRKPDSSNDDDSDDELLAFDQGSTDADLQEADDVLENVEFVDDDEDEAREDTPVSRLQPAISEDEGEFEEEAPAALAESGDELRPDRRAGAERAIARASVASVLMAVAAILLGVGTLIYAGSFLIAAAESRKVELPPEGNLVENWSFELVLDKEPLDWELEGPAEIDSVRPAAGFQSLKLAAGARARSSRMQVQAGKTYRMSGLWKLIDAGPVLMAVVWLNSDGKPHGLPHSLEPLNGNRSYRSSGTLVAVPEGAASAVMEVYNHSGQAWCDRLSFELAGEDDGEVVQTHVGVQTRALSARLGRAGIPELSLRERPFIEALELSLGPAGSPLGRQTWSRKAGESKSPAPGQILVSRQVYNVQTDGWVRMRFQTEVRSEQLAFTYAVPRGDLDGLPGLGLRIQLGKTARLEKLLYQGQEQPWQDGSAADELLLEESGYELAVFFNRPMRFFVDAERPEVFHFLLDATVLAAEYGSELDYEVRFGVSSRGQISSVEGLMTEARRLLEAGKLGEALEVANEAQVKARERSRLEKARALKSEVAAELAVFEAEIRNLEQSLEALQDPGVAALMLARIAQIEPRVRPQAAPLKALGRLRAAAERIVARSGEDASERRGSALFERARGYSSARQYALCIVTLEEMLRVAPEHRQASAARELLEASRQNLQQRLARRLEKGD